MPVQTPNTEEKILQLESSNELLKSKNSQLESNIEQLKSLNLQLEYSNKQLTEKVN